MCSCFDLCRAVSIKPMYASRAVVFPVYGTSLLNPITRSAAMYNDEDRPGTDRLHQPPWGQLIFSTELQPPPSSHKPATPRR